MSIPIKISKEATIIYNIIKKEGIFCKLEYSFADLLGKSGKPYRFDFALFNKDGTLKCLIEYDSLLHFDKKNGLVKDYKNYRERDLKKNTYCLAHHIKLYRISCWDLDSLKTYDDLFQEKFLVKTRWHNYDIAREHNLL